MTYTEVKFRGSLWLPGFGQVDKLVNVVTAAPDPSVPPSPETLRLKGPTGVVTVPWSSVAYAFEAETVQTVVVKATPGLAEPTKQMPVGEVIDAATHQPPPPPKKGGRPR